jgi:hypothetical protein
MILPGWADTFEEGCSTTGLVVFLLATYIMRILIHRLAAKPKLYKQFPAWATIEIALTTYLLPFHGLGCSIL